MFKSFDVKLIIIRTEFNQVERGEVTGRIVKEHIFRAGVRRCNRPAFRTGIPGINGVVILHAWIRRRPGGFSNFMPEITRADILGHRAICAAYEIPRLVILDGGKESICNANSVIGVLA